MAQFLDYVGLQHFHTKLKEQLTNVEIVKADSLSADSAWNESGIHARLLNALKQRRVVLIEHSGELYPSALSGANTVPDLNTDSDILFIRLKSPNDSSRIIELQVYDTDDIEVLEYDVQSSYIKEDALNNYEKLDDIKANLKIEYNTNDKKIELKYGTDILTEIDATPFIKDGMLDDTEVITVGENDSELLENYAVGDKLIKFIWAGVYQTDAEGNVTEDKDGNPVAKVDYIKVSDIAPELNTANTEISENIIIAGGPLADEVKAVFSSYKDADGNVVIPKDMSMQEVLTLLVCKELFPTAITTTGASLRSTVGAPTITLATTTVEVGTKVSFTVKNGVSSYTATPHTASGFTYGWSAADDNTKDGSDTSKSGTYSTPAVENSVTTLTVTSTGNETKTANGTNVANSATIEGEITAVEGTNTVNASNTSATYKSTFSELPIYYGCSNTGRTNDGSKNYPSTYKASTTITSDSVSKSATAKTFTAKYKYFIGSYNELVAANYTSDIIRNLNGAKSDFITVNGNTIISSDTWTSAGYSVVIACPNKYKLASITDSIGNDNMAAFHKAENYSGGVGDEADIDVTTGSVTTKYHIYVCKIEGNLQASFKNITLKKA